MSGGHFWLSQLGVEGSTLAALWMDLAEETGGREAHGGCCLSLARRE